jgi:HD-GYP domain-containing protein (c-di-GMP phosphodiesterase class II)
MTRSAVQHTEDTRSSAITVAKRCGILTSVAYQAELLRSERQRVLWLLAVVLTMLAFTLGRNLMFFRGQHLLLATLPVTLLAVVAALVQLQLLARAEQQRRNPPPWIWPAAAVVEASLPTIILLALARLPSVGPEHALSYPTITVYFLVTLLSTLHLRPSICILSGATAAAGYLGVAAYAYSRARAAAVSLDLHFSIPVTFGATMLIAGFVAAGVATQLRRRLLTALGEAELRRRATVRARDTLIFALAKLAETRDTDTGTHLQRIAEYSALLATELSEHHAIDAGWIESLRVAAPLHDIGKVGLPDDVLKKPGPLTTAERAVMQAHPQIGADALLAIEDRGRADLLELGVQIAAGHHERWDGKGYPARLRGEEIPLAARIVAVADVYDALTSARVYKPAFGHGEARRMILEGSGTQFDPTVVAAFEAQSDAFDEIRRRLAEPES